MESRKAKSESKNQENLELLPSPTTGDILEQESVNFPPAYN